MAETEKQPLTARLGFFVLGGLGSTTVNWSILNAAHRFLGWPDWAGYALSVSLTAFIFFLWSYFINFRTSRVWQHCLGRYIVCVVIACLMNYAIGLMGLKHYGTSLVLKFLIIGVVQSFTGGIKFLLYHFWVFPHAEAAEKNGPETAVAGR